MFGKNIWFTLSINIFLISEISSNLTYNYENVHCPQDELYTSSDRKNTVSYNMLIFQQGTHHPQYNKNYPESDLQCSSCMPFMLSDKYFCKNALICHGHKNPLMKMS